MDLRYLIIKSIRFAEFSSFQGERPEWNYTLVYEGETADELREKCLELTLWDARRFQVNNRRCYVMD